MKFTDLTKEHREHFLEVVSHYGDKFPEDTTHVELDNERTLLKYSPNGIFFWDSKRMCWHLDIYRVINSYQVPDKPWYDPEDVAFKSKSRIDVIGQNGNDGEHYKENTVKGKWVEITEPSDIKKYPVGTKVKIDGKEDVITQHYGDNDFGFDVSDNNVRYTCVFTPSEWDDFTVEVFVEEPEIKPKDMKCFEEVAEVLGEEYAEKELQKVIDCEECYASVEDLLFYDRCINSFCWEESPQGDDFWESVHRGHIPEEYLAFANEPEEVTEVITEESTGGKSSYYLVEIPIDAPTLEIDHEKGVVRFMLEEYIKYGLDNDFDRGNICKANHRLGGKKGVSVEYDTNKIEHYNNRIRKTYNRG